MQSSWRRTRSAGDVRSISTCGTTLSGELVKHKVIAIKYTESRNQHTDILTKAIGAEDFVWYRRLLMNLPG